MNEDTLVRSFASNQLSRRFVLINTSFAGFRTFSLLQYLVRAVPGKMNSVLRGIGVVLLFVASICAQSGADLAALAAEMPTCAVRCTFGMCEDTKLKLFVVELLNVDPHTFYLQRHQCHLYMHRQAFQCRYGRMRRRQLYCQGGPE